MLAPARWRKIYIFDYITNLMDWKEFFKLTKGKVFLAIGFLILGFFLFIGAFGCEIGMDKSPVCKLLIVLMSLVYIFFWPGMIILNLGSDWINSVRPLGQTSPYAKYEIVFQLGAIIINLLWIYLLVCLIYFIVRKIRNKQ